MNDMCAKFDGDTIIGLICLQSLGGTQWQQVRIIYTRHHVHVAEILLSLTPRDNQPTK